MKFTLRLLLLLSFIFVGFVGMGMYWTFFKPLPDYNATLHLTGLQGSVDVHWDPYGVPHIYAESEDDLYFTAGYLHAQDRLWQMTLSQISTEGRFAEFLGEEFIPFDQHQRTIGIWDTAQKIEAASSDSLLFFLQRYADGVNRFIEDNRAALPIEFTLLDIEPIPWTPAHSIAMARQMAWNQNVHWWSKLIYAVLAEKLEPQKLRELFFWVDHEYPAPDLLTDEESQELIFSALPLLEQEMEIRSLLFKRGSSFGSNAWAVSGSKTESGFPLLAGDPHMGLSIPGFWYEVHYHTPHHRVTGVTIPGVPFVIMGQNRDLAWTITNLMADDTDFFIELENPVNSGQYLTGYLSIQDFQYKNELIRVKGANDRIHRVRLTQNGPVINDIHPDGSLLGGKPVTMKWAGHEVSHELWSMYNMNKARTVEDFKDAVAIFKSPAVNFIYADLTDNIALFSGAAIPIRNHSPLLFRKGWDPSWQWQGFIPFEELPRVVNPENGYIAHANNKLHDDNYPHYIASFWAPPSRIKRIQQFLESNNNLTRNTMQVMQNDTYSEHSREITDLIIPIIRAGNSNNRFDDALSYLGNWNHEYDLTSTAASIFDLFFINFLRNHLVEDIGEEAYLALSRSEHLMVQIGSTMLRENRSLFDITPIERIDTNAAMHNNIILRSMQETLDNLTEQYGAEPIEWRWGNLHTITLRPPLLGDIADNPDVTRLFRVVVNNLFNKGPFPAPGHGMSINKGEYSWHQPFDMHAGASLRRIVDFSTPHRSLSVLPTGQSGNPLSAHYGDQTSLWLEGRYRYIYQDSTFFDQTSYQTMRLLPGE